MLAVELDPAAEPQHFVGRYPVAGDTRDDVAAFGEGAGLVEQHGGDGPHPFEREAVLDEYSVAGRHRCREGDHEWDRQSEGMWAGDHQHGDGAGDRLVGVTCDRPGDERDHRGRGGDVEQPSGEPVGEYLGAAVGRLGVGDEPLDAGEGGVVADGGDPHPDRGVGRDGAGDDAIAGALGDGLRFAGDHRLVELRLAFFDGAVCRNPGTGPHQDQLPLARGR